MAVLKMTTQNLTTGRPSCIGDDGNEKGASPSTPRIPRSPDFLLFRGHGRRRKAAWEVQQARLVLAECIAFLGFSLSAA